MTSQVELSEKQRSIVYAGPGPVCVKASAGSGKTRVLTQRIRYLLKQSNKKILALTFTNKAGQEIKERLSDISDIDNRTFIGTFHSFCQSILESHGKLIGYSTMPHIFEDEADRLELVESAISQVPSYASVYRKKEGKRRRDFCYRALHFVSKVKRDLISESDIENHTNDDNIVLLYRNYQELLKVQNAIDFDDLLLEAYNLFASYSRIAALYRRSFFAICVDEAQDLNKAQYQFLKTLTGDEFNNILMVGDPNQSIFHFNGSSPDYMNKFFVEDFTSKTVELTENFRSSVEVLKAAEKIIPEAEYIEGTVKRGIFEMHEKENETAEAEWVASKIQEILSMKKHSDIEGDICPEKIAVLARNKYLFKSLEKVLSQCCISYYYKMTPGSLKFESSVMQVFDLALRIKLNSQDLLHKKQLLKILDLDGNENSSLADIAKTSVRTEYKKIISLVMSLDENGENFKRNLENYRDMVSIDDDNDKNMLFNEINELLVHWYNYAKSVDNTSIHQFKNSMALGQTHPAIQHSGVTLSTVHTMKGQEFDIVFIIGMDDETFPDYRAVKSGGVDMLQEKNNLYVAFTRSKRWLYITWPANRSMPWGDTKRRKKSRFLVGFESEETTPSRNLTAAFS